MKYSFVLLSTQTSKNGNLQSTRVYGIFDDRTEAETAMLKKVDNEKKYFDRCANIHGRFILTDNNGSKEIYEVCTHVDHKAA